MALTANSLRPQIDLPAWEMLRPAPAVSAATACSCAADNSNFHVQHGRYVYYLLASASFYRYDTWTDTYQQLASPPLTLLTWSSMRFAGARGYDGRVIAAVGNNGIQVGMPFGQVGTSFDIRITDGTGKGQRRIITNVATPVIADMGSASGAGAVTSITDSNKAWAINQWVGYTVRVISGTGAGQVRKILYNSATVLTVSDVNKYAEDINCNVQWVAAAAGSIYQIESCVVTVDTNWATNPDATSRFTIESGGIYLATSLTTSFYALAYYDILMDIWYIKTASSTIITTTATDGSLERTTENASIWDRGTAVATGSDTTHLADTTKNWVVNKWAGYYVRIFTGAGEGQLKKIDSNTATILTWTGAVTSPDATSRYLIVGFDAGTCSAASVAQTANSASVTASAYGNVLTVSAVGSGALIPGQNLNGIGLGAVLAFNNATSSGAVVTVGSTTGVQVGMVMTMISGTGTLPSLTHVINVLSSTTFTISTTPSPALSSTNLFVLGGGFGGQTLPAVATTCSGTTTDITVSSTTNYLVGMAPYVTAGTGVFVPGTIITAVPSATHLTVSTAPSTPLSGATITAVFPIPVILGSQLTGATPGGTGTYLIYPLQPVVSSTTVTANGAAVLVDSTKTTWGVNRWNNLSVRITAGAGKGQVRSIQATIPGYLSVTPDWTTALDTSSTYEIQGDYDKLYMVLAANSSVFVQNLAADILTTGRQETYGSASGCFAQYSDHPPISIVSGTYAGSTMTIVTTNPHNYKIGQAVTIMGDTGAGRALNNVAQTIVTVADNTHFTFTVGGSASMTVPAQSTSTLVDSSKNWAINQWAGCIVTYNIAAPTQASGLATVYSEYIIANNATTLFFSRAGTAPVQGLTRYVVTQTFMCPSKSAIGAMDAGLSVGTNTTAILQDVTKSFASGATCSSSGTTVTTTANLKGLAVGMYITNTGTGTLDALTQVTSLTDDTHFVINKTPIVALSGATVTGTFWPTASLNGRRARIIAGLGMFQEWPLTGSTVNTATMAAITTAPGSGVSAYEIIPLPARGLAAGINWAYGLSDTTKRGSYIYAPRGTSVQIDRLNIQTDTWEVLQTIPQTESFTTGTQWAYDGVDKIYIVANGTLRMLYLDLNTGILHGGMMLPWLVGTPVIGNRMEIFSTADGLKYLWTNRQTNLECFRTLIFW